MRNKVILIHKIGDILVDSFHYVALFGSPYKSMQVEYYQRVTGIGITNKNLQVNAS
jgi:hypothetical protein